MKIASGFSVDFVSVSFYSQSSPLPVAPTVADASKEASALLDVRLPNTPITESRRNPDAVQIDPTTGVREECWIYPDGACEIRLSEPSGKNYRLYRTVGGVMELEVIWERDRFLHIKRGDTTIALYGAANWTRENYRSITHGNWGRGDYLHIEEVQQKFRNFLQMIRR